MVSANRYCLVRFYPHTVVKPNDVFLDIGANIGLWSAAALRTPGVPIFAIEPVAKLCHILKRNLTTITSADKAKILDYSVTPLVLQSSWLHQTLGRPRKPTSLAPAATTGDTRAHDAYAKFIVEAIATVCWSSMC